MSDVIASRAARIAFGVTLLLGTCVLVHVAVTDRFRSDLHASHIVIATWAAAAAIALVVRLLVAALRPTVNPDALRRGALAVPSVGIALLLPLTLHMPFCTLESQRFFDSWTMGTIIAAGAPHLLFALFVLVRADQLVGDRAPVTIKTIYIYTCVVGLVPFVLPALFIAITGVVFIPLLRMMERVAYRDRVASGELPLAFARTA